MKQVENGRESQEPPQKNPLAASVTFLNTYRIIEDHFSLVDKYPGARFRCKKNKGDIVKATYPHIHQSKAEALTTCVCCDHSSKGPLKSKLVKTRFHYLAWAIIFTVTLGVLFWLGEVFALITAVLGVLFYLGAVQIKKRRFWDLVCKLGVFLFGTGGMALAEDANRLRNMGYAVRVFCMTVMTSLFVAALIMSGGVGLALWASVLCIGLSVVNSVGIGMSMTGNHMRATQLENRIEGKIPKDYGMLFGRKFLDVNGCLGAWLKLVCILSLIPGISMLNTATTFLLLCIERVSSMISTFGIMLMTKIRFDRLKNYQPVGTAPVGTALEFTQHPLAKIPASADTSASPATASSLLVSGAACAL